MKPFIIKHGELQLQASLAVPMYAFLDGPASMIHSALFERFASLGASLNDIKISSGIPNLNELGLTYHLLAFNALVKLSLDKVEINFLDTTLVTRDRVEDVYRKTFGAIGVISTNYKIKEFSLTRTLHGIIEEESVSEFMQSFIRTIPKGLGPIAGQGAVFYYSGEGQTKASSTVVDVSARIENGLFVRLSVTFDGQQISVDALPEIAQQAFDHQTESLGLTLK